MDASDYRNFYDKVGKLIGWDFSCVKCFTEGQVWDMYHEVANICRKTDILLDIGSGGGEAILPIADSVLLLVGVDQSPSMVENAMRNAAHANVPNVRFVKLEADNLTFPEAFFQIVTCRQSPFFAKEVAKVLTRGGVFITQQVSETDKINIKKAFGRGQSFDVKAGSLKQHYITELSEAGFSQIQCFDYHVQEYYETAEDLIYLLKHTPIIPEFGQAADDFDILERFIVENQTEKGIKTNSDRFVIRATL